MGVFASLVAHRQRCRNSTDACTIKDMSQVTTNLIEVRPSRVVGDRAYIAGTRVSVECFGIEIPAEVQKEPLFDPKGEKIKA